MNLFQNIGISFKGNYLEQGTLEEKCKLAKKLKLPNIELLLGKSEENVDFKRLFDVYNKNLIIGLPVINHNLSNLKEVEQILLKLILYRVEKVTVKAFNLGISEFEWSTDEEKKQKIEDMALGVATLASNKIVVSIENYPFGKSDGYFGQNINQISDLLVYSRKILVEKFGFNETDANQYIKVCLNASNAMNNSNNKELDKWFNIFKDSISIIKVNDNDNYEELINLVFSKCIEEDLECPILLSEKVDLEEINNKVATLFNIVNLYVSNNNLTGTNEFVKKNNSSQAGFTNVIVVSMIVLTILIGMLMVYVKFNS